MRESTAESRRRSTKPTHRVFLRLRHINFITNVNYLELLVLISGEIYGDISPCGSYNFLNLLTRS